MSSGSLPQGVCLLVKYHGAKALQHFSTGPIDQTSSFLFRQDLGEMRFPLPKAANTRLAPDATVVAWWPDVSRKTHPVLYNHLTNNTNAASRDGHLARLSIWFIAVREIGAEGQTSAQLASVRQHNILPPTPQGLPSPAKRARLQSFTSVPLSHSGPPDPTLQRAASSNGPPPFIPVPQSHPGPPYPVPQRATETNPTAQKRSWDGQIIPSGFPARPPASSVPFPQQTQALSSTQPPRPLVPAPPGSAHAIHNLPPKPSVAPLPLLRTPPTDPRPLHRQQTQVLSSAPVSQAPIPASEVAAATTSARVTAGQPSKPSLAPLPPTPNTSTPNTERPVAQGRSATRLVSNVSTQPVVVARGVSTAQPVPTPTAQAPESQTTQNRLPSPGLTPGPAVPPTRPAAPHAQQESTSFSPPDQGSKDAELEALRKRMKSMEEMQQTQLNMKVRLDETVNKLQEEQEERRMLEEMVSAARESEADAKRRLQEVQELFEEEGRRRSEADDLLVATRRKALSYRELCDKAEQERDELAGGYDRVREELSHSRRNEDRIQDELDRVVQKFEQEMYEETNRYKRCRDQLGSVERSEAALKQHCDEATQEVVSLTRTRDRDAHDTRVAKRRDEEALHRCEEKLRTQQIMIRQAEGAMHAARSSEKALRSRLEEVESRLEVESGLEAELEVERRLRREAEDAIADIRRECREPFVVPSLLDAFVELAKLTTAATTLDGAVTTSVGKENDKTGDTPPTTDSAMDAASGDASTVAVTANGVRNSLLRHITPQSPQCTPPSAQFSPHIPRLNASNSPDVLAYTGSPSNQVKLEPE